MPRISDEYVNCAVYLYPTVAHAKRGEAFGGSGFVVKVMAKFDDPYKRHFYVVTNSHVISGGSSVIRINKKDGTVATIKTNPSLWTYSDKADLAIYLIELDDSYSVHAFSTKKLLTKFKLESKGLGVGDDTFVVGRFINHEGRQRNRPTVRFGTIAMMPDANDGVYNSHMSSDQESYLVETHTVCGYSGSPVFFYIPAFSKRPERDAANNPLTWRGPWLLGIDWGHVLTHYPVKKHNKNNQWQDTGMFVESTTGMMCVTPAWYLEELLNEPHLVEDRAEVEKNWSVEASRVLK